MVNKHIVTILLAVLAAIVAFFIGKTMQVQEPGDQARSVRPAVPTRPQPGTGPAAQLAKSPPVAPSSTNQPTPAASAGKAGAVSVVRFVKFSSPQGRFEVMIPQGWVFEKIAADESFFKFLPADNDRGIPAVAIGFVEATALSNYLGLTYGGIYTEISAEDFLRRVWLPYLSREFSNVKMESLSGPQQNLGEVVFTMTDKGKDSRIKTVAYMEYVPNPVMGTVYSFALLNLVVYDKNMNVTEGKKLDMIAGAIFSSFKPNERWGQEVAEAISQGLRTQQGIVSSSMKRLSALEMNMRRKEFGGATKTQRGWADALGGTVELHDSSGNIYRTWDEYKYYYKEGNEIRGTNNPSDLYGKEQVYR